MTIPDFIVSNTAAAQWSGSLSVFGNAYATTPSATYEGISAEVFAQHVAPPHPVICTLKEAAPYFLPCALREAPLIGKTLERAQARGLPTVGKMRSARHVVAGGAIKLDLDGVSKDVLRSVYGTLKRMRVAHCLYSTHSLGLKAGIRARLILFLDQPLEPLEFRCATQAAATVLLGASLDPSEGYLHQLAGTFVAHPDRVAKAFRFVDVSGSCLSSQALLALAPQRTAVSTKHAASPCPALNARDRRKMIAALDWISADNFSTWVKVGVMLKALSPGDEGLALWTQFSARANSQHQRRNAERQYNPASMWEGFTPAVAADVALAALLALARDGAAQSARSDLATGDLTDIGFDALTYLGRNHPKFADELASRTTNK